MVRAVDAVSRRFDGIAFSEDPVPPRAVLALYDELPAVELDEMLGDWEGRCIPTGHPGEARLAQLGWAGHRFRDLDGVDPLMRIGDGGLRTPSAFVGSGSLRRVEYRDVLTATVIYDDRPFLDHFRRVADGVVLGLMERKGAERPLPFRLWRIGPA